MSDNLQGKRLGGGRDHGPPRFGSSTTKAEHEHELEHHEQHEISLDTALPTPPSHYNPSTVSYPSPHLGFMPLAFPSAWENETDLPMPGLQKMQPVGVESMPIMEGNYWCEFFESDGLVCVCQCSRTYLHSSSADKQSSPRALGPYRQQQYANDADTNIHSTGPANGPDCLLHFTCCEQPV